MAIYEFDQKRPKFGKDCYVADEATIIGGVTIGDGCYVGPGAVLRGDYGDIVIGSNCSIEENVMIHARPSEICTIGDHVTVGHACMIHNAKHIGDWCVLGMASVISDWVVLGKWVVVAEGAVVKNNTKIPDEKVIAGIPAKIIADVKPEYMKIWGEFKRIYVELARTYRDRLKRIK